MKKLSVRTNPTFQDESGLLFMTLVGGIVATIFATNFHDDLDHTMTVLAPEGAAYPFPPHTRPPAAKLTAAIGGFFIGIFCWSVIGMFRWFLIRQLFKYRDWIKSPKSLKTRLYYLCLSSLLPRKRFLYTFHRVMPKYPLPSLKSTCAKKLTNIEPLVTEKEFEEIKLEMQKFEQAEGRELQRVLKKRYETEHNWVADLWDNYAYLISRAPLYCTNFCNQGGLQKADCSPCAYQTQCARAACMTYHYMRFYELIVSKSLNPLLVQDLVPICSYRYQYMFSCTRLPGKVMDELKTYESSKHIVVFRKGILFRLDLYAIDVTGNESLLAPEEIQSCLETILEDTKDVENTEWNPSVFTTQNRDLWAEIREKLKSTPINRASLNDAESAIFHLILEDSSPQGLREECHNNLCGDGLNRWFDKSATVAVYENGMAGGNSEHTAADATLTSRMLEYVWGKCQYRDGRGWAEDSVLHPTVSSPTRLKWNLEDFHLVIPQYLEIHNQLRKNVDLNILMFHRGKGSIKKLKTSPDGFMQMALQLAFYRIHKTVPKTYETAMTRFFKYGRTETIRPVSMHSVAFTKAMDDPSSTPEERIRHLKLAISHHHQRKLEAMNGQAADRHMFGLYVASKFLGIKPKLFDFKVFTDCDQLSTSQTPYICDKAISSNMDVFPAGGAFVPQREDGYGVYYLFLGENYTSINISSYRACPETNSEIFAEKLKEAMDDMQQLLAR